MIVQIPPQFATNTLLSWSKYRAAMTGASTPAQRTAARNILYIWLNQCSMALDQPTTPTSEYADPPVTPRVQTEDDSDYGEPTGNLEYPEP